MANVKPQDESQLTIIPQNNKQGKQFLDDDDMNQSFLQLMSKWDREDISMMTE